jgi:hypothetical protein
MNTACFLKTNHTILIRAFVLVRKVVLNTCNSEFHEVICASTSSGRDAAYSEHEMFVCIAPCRELDKSLHGIRPKLSLDLCSTFQCSNSPSPPNYKFSRRPVAGYCVAQPLLPLPEIAAVTGETVYAP